MLRIRKRAAECNHIWKICNLSLNILNDSGNRLINCKNPVRELYWKLYEDWSFQTCGCGWQQQDTLWKYAFSLGIKAQRRNWVVHVNEIPRLLSHHPQKPHLQHHKHHPPGWAACPTSSTLLVLVIQDGGGGEWKVVIGGGQAELTQDRMIPCFVISPVFLWENGSEFALLTVCHTFLPPYFSPPFVPQDVSFHSTLSCIIARLIFPK